MCQVRLDGGGRTDRETDATANRHPVTQTDKQMDRQTCTGPDMEESEMTGSQPFLSQQYLHTVLVYKCIMPCVVFSEYWRDSFSMKRS